MRRLLASASVALVLITGTASALTDGGLDAAILDGGAPDVTVTDAAIDVSIPDASTDASGTDAIADAVADSPVDAPASDGSSIKDAKSDVCDPNVEPCTTRADTGPDNDAGDNEESGSNGGCSCDSAPAMASTTPIALLLVAFALLSRRRKR